MSQRRDFILLFGMDAVEGERKSQNGVFVLVSVFPLQRKKGNDGRPLLGLVHRHLSYGLPRRKKC